MNETEEFVDPMKQAAEGWANDFVQQAGVAASSSVTVVGAGVTRTLVDFFVDRQDEAGIAKVVLGLVDLGEEAHVKVDDGGRVQVTVTVKNDIVEQWAKGGEAGE
ncbi:MULTISPECIES: hypothetical protein [Streptomyces]|uniref:hypothetical protein n=1 Tax=Streptomyces TaxID=1883 RepID=UPI001E415C95|nr:MULTISPECIES: hypothetical protein [Streptomyces]UFQ16430.1 hypothetical protein J2N69_16255 [Streptomyces huasconensis]WCL86032.1 hypothetical protein PPN52_16265 [Streptomyces sp. JCM 35825]